LFYLLQLQYYKLEYYYYNKNARHKFKNRNSEGETLALDINEEAKDRGLN